MSQTVGWQRRYTLVGLCFCATFVCYIDRVNISVAIIPMADEFGWNVETQGTVLSFFFIGYLLTQIVGGRLADRYGGKASKRTNPNITDAFKCGVLYFPFYFPQSFRYFNRILNNQ